MEASRQEVLRRLKEAADLFISNPRSSLLIPEIRTNLGYAIPEARNVEDVAAIPGRITCAFGKSFYCMPPQFGASDHIARVILTAMKHDQAVRSAIDLRYEESIVKSLPSEELCVFNRNVETEESRSVERHTMNLMVDFCYKLWDGKSHKFIIDEGDVGKEKTLFVLGKDPVDVVKISLSLLDLI
ncbi:thiamine-phosphate synthase family protein [Sulfuracidifex tepidarius]|uniref:Bifunctional thiamine biosynthesis protein ThiDN n=1 Tax=Sulfuracidifex tepidarius TaxID=1294262 RepID=A0A510DWR2_9CREN|nr:thiamine-phosphate synthase family protein [Sulfuracidifex tepidarius]BBG24666.1 Bifunctional thiamine biosynthesis protein ThiDN [Sulfuracidifex tepidarius]BBG27454.1 Bifunctional thiamine biosynthesis protein ThiDN [Sulfuracidifex tepidarius]